MGRKLIRTIQWKILNLQQTLQRNQIKDRTVSNSKLQLLQLVNAIFITPCLFCRSQYKTTDCNRMIEMWKAISTNEFTEDRRGIPEKGRVAWTFGWASTDSWMLWTSSPESRDRSWSLSRTASHLCRSFYPPVLRICKTYIDTLIYDFLPRKAK